jgi:hypothetical protein
LFAEADKLKKEAAKNLEKASSALAGFLKSVAKAQKKYDEAQIKGKEADRKKALTKLENEKVLLYRAERVKKETEALIKLREAA